MRFGPALLGSAQTHDLRRSTVVVVTASINKREWVSTATRPPADGEFVLAKTKLGTIEHRVTFRATPVPRWEDANFIRHLAFYEYWCPVS